MFVLLWHNVEKRSLSQTSINVFKVSGLAEKSMFFCPVIYGIFFSLILSEDVCSAVAVSGDDLVLHLLHPLCPGRHTQVLWRDHQLDGDGSSPGSHSCLPVLTYSYTYFHFFTVYT
jgi:hypothetical protein